MKPNKQTFRIVLGAATGWPTGNGKKRSNSHACCLAQLCLAAASFFSISCGQSCGRTRYSTRNGFRECVSRYVFCPPPTQKNLFPDPSLPSLFLHDCTKITAIACFVLKSSVRLALRASAAIMPLHAFAYPPRLLSSPSSVCVVRLPLPPLSPNQGIS